MAFHRVGKHEQIVAVAAHARREVIEPKQVIEPDRVVFVELECLDQRQLLLYEGSASAGERFEHLADLQADAVLAGQADRLEVDVVDRARQLPHLFVGVDRQRRDLRHATTLAESIDLLGQLDLRDLQCAAA